MESSKGFFHGSFAMFKIWERWGHLVSECSLPGTVDGRNAPVDMVNILINRVSYMLGGAGFLPSIVSYACEVFKASFCGCLKPLPLKAPTKFIIWARFPLFF